MNKKLLTLAVAAAMVAPLAVQAAGTGPTVYGDLHVAVENWSHENNATGDFWDVNSRQSKFGIKGDEDLGNGLSAIYKLEFQVDIDGDATAGTGGLTDRTGGASSLSARNQYVGLSHKNYGTLILGRHDTPMKMMTIKVDQFNEQSGDWNEVNDGVVDAMHTRRVNNAILYKSPNFSGFSAAALVAPGETNVDDGIADGIASIGANYSNSGIYVAAAWEELEFAGADSPCATGATCQDEETISVAASYSMAGFKVGGIYEDQEDAGNINGRDVETWQLNASYKFGNTVVKGLYQEGEEDQKGMAGSSEYDAYSLGVDHHFSKRTTVYAQYTDTDSDTNNRDFDVFSMGMRHKF